MNEHEVLTLLLYCTELDQRHSPNEVKVAAWSDVFSAEAFGMGLEFAQGVARKHYGLLDEMISPAVFVRAWREHRRFTGVSKPVVGDVERHCGKTGCRCTHGQPCYRGWIDFEGEPYTTPCGVCRADLRDALAKIPPPGQREQFHYEQLRNRHRV